MILSKRKSGNFLKEQQNEILDSKLDLELSRFERELKLLLSSQKVATASSGAVIGSGTAQNIRISTFSNWNCPQYSSNVILLCLRIRYIHISV